MTDYTERDGELDESKPTLNMFEEAIRQWGIDRNIIPESGATVMAQFSKFFEEYAEFLTHWAELENWCLEWGDGGADYPENCIICPGCGRELQIKTDLEDDFGDMLVCLIQAMRLAGTDMETCLAKAWNDIKDRKGTMVAGKFVKESP